MKYVVYLILLMILISCSKEGMIKVKTVNKVTNTPMTGVTIYVIEQFSNSDPNETVFSGETDSNGELMIELKYKKNGKYTIYQSQVENSCWHNEKSIFLEHEKNQNITFEFAPCAQLKLKIENVNCEGGGDNFKLFHEGSDVGFLELDPNQPNIEGDGCYYYEGSSFSNVPMGRRFYRWEVTRSGTTETYYDTIYLQENEQRVYEILY